MSENNSAGVTAGDVLKYANVANNLIRAVLI